MSESRVCPQCGCELPENALAGQCPQCMLAVGLEEPSKTNLGDQTGSSPDPAAGGFVPPTPEELANLIPQFEVLELLAKGGMGAVYKGRQKSLDRLVAIKILPPDIGRDAAFAERFSREARALGRLNHPNIVAVHDFGNANGLFYFVMEYVDGANLRRLMRDGGLSPKDVLAIVPQVCDALQFAHDEGIVHRDIKPENIMIDKRGRVKIADFGLAKLMGQEHIFHSLTGSHQVMGTIRYMAPEQMEGAKDIDHRADIYSLGVVFYELLTGELPLGRFAPPSKKVEIDVRLDEIVLRTLEKEPKQRYQHAGEVKTEVETVMRTPGEPPPRPDGTTADASAGRARATEGWGMGRLLRDFAMDFDEVDRQYTRWVWLPWYGFLAFYAVYVMLLRFSGSVFRITEYILVRGLTAGCVMFVVLNVIWYILRALKKLSQAPVVPGPWTAEQISEQLRRYAVPLRYTGVLTFAGCIAMALLQEQLALAVLWALIAGTIICRSARSLARLRDPGVVPLILAMVPLSPAVMLGFPVSLIILRMMARPEVKAFLDAQARDREAARTRA